MKAQTHSLRARILVLLSVLITVTLLYTIGSAQASEDPIRLEIKKPEIRMGGAANGGRSCFNPWAKVREQRRSGLRSWGIPELRLSDVPSLPFATLLDERVLENANGFLTKRWRQKDCDCLKVGGEEIRIVNHSPDMIELETGHRFIRTANDQIKLELDVRAWMKVDCSDFGIQKTVEEAHDVQVSFLLSPEMIPQESPEYTRRRGDLATERKVLCDVAL